MHIEIPRNQKRHDFRLGQIWLHPQKPKLLKTGIIDGPKQRPFLTIEHVIHPGLSQSKDKVTIRADIIILRKIIEKQAGNLKLHSENIVP